MGEAVVINDTRLVTLVGSDPGENQTPDRALIEAPIWEANKNVPFTVSLPSWGRSDQPLTIGFSLRYADAEVEVYTTAFKFNQGASHEFTVPTKLRGAVTVNVSVDSSNAHRHWLRKSITVDVPVSGSAEPGTVALVNGDINNTNYINTDDYLILSEAFDTTPTDTKWDIRADLDGSNLINTDDYLILSDNFDTTGDE